MLLRPVANTVFLPTWTVAMVSYAASAVAITRDAGLFRRLERVWARGILDFSGIRTQVSGAEHVDPAQSYVVCANHQSYMDIPILFLTLPEVPGFVAKHELKKVPFLATALRLGGHVTIDRKNRSRAAASLQQAAETIHRGQTVLIFPEGTRGDAESLGRFKLGAFHLAKAAQVPVLPIGLRGSGRIMSRSNNLIHPGTVEVNIGAPIPVGDVETLEVHALADRVREEVARLAGAPLSDAFNG